MSRAMNLRLDEAEVLAQCKARGVKVSASEPLPGSGTHLVCTTSEGAEEMRRRFKDVLIPGKVKRFAFYRVPSAW